MDDMQQLHKLINGGYIITAINESGLLYIHLMHSHTKDKQSIYTEDQEVLREAWNIYTAQ
jgi:hypothetical protein